MYILYIVLFQPQDNSRDRDQNPDGSDKSTVDNGVMEAKVEELLSAVLNVVTVALFWLPRDGGGDGVNNGTVGANHGSQS